MLLGIHPPVQHANDADAAVDPAEEHGVTVVFKRNAPGCSGSIERPRPGVSARREMQSSSDRR
jgi:hypothetical protein